MSDTLPAPQVSIIEVTPEMAADFVGTNFKNRKVRPGVVEAYARAITAGQWQLTGESIKFDPDGNLIDGQHRCMAIIRAGVPVMMTVIRGVEPDAQAVMDSGVKRQAHDYLLMHGIPNSAVVAAVARFSLRQENYAKSLTNSEIMTWVADHPEVHHAADASNVYRNTIDVHPSVLGVAWMRLHDLDSLRCEEFFASVAANRTDGEGDPRNALIRRLTAARRSSQRLSQEVQLSMLFRAWNAWVTGERLTKLQSETRGGIVKIPEPVPFGTKPRSHRKTRVRTGIVADPQGEPEADEPEGLPEGLAHKQQPAPRVRVPSQEEYEAFDWPTLRQTADGPANPAA